MDDLDTELLRIALWTVFASAALVAGRPTEPGPLGQRTAGEYADDLLADVCKRWPDLAEPATPHA